MIFLEKHRMAGQLLSFILGVMFWGTLYYSLTFAVSDKLAERLFGNIFGCYREVGETALITMLLVECVMPIRSAIAGFIFPLIAILIMAAQWLLSI